MPEPEICADDEMFFRRRGGVSLDLGTGALRLTIGSEVSFDTYFNLFNLGVWTVRTRLSGLALHLAGSGRVSVRLLRGSIINEPPEPDSDEQLDHDKTRLTRDQSVIHEAEYDLAEEGIEIPLAKLLGALDETGEVPAQTGLVHLHVAALEEGARLTAGAWLADASPEEPSIRLAMSVTSFRREAETAATARRVTAFIDAEGPQLGAQLDLIIVDNGQTLDLPPHPHLRLVPNRNLGGSGGFARGLAEARTGGHTHVLFCDDDAAFMVESLRRTIAFLRLARSTRAAVAGAMISAGAPWAMWENGATFNRVCRPQFLGTDLRHADEVGRMELSSARPKPHNFYGGWWYFAFPLSAVTHDPFPFFVRGDDISFSLANDFEISPINGVVSFQEDFSAKESPHTLYLDLRNHLHHHLVHPNLEIGPLGTASIAWRFIARSIVRMHYETAEAQLLAWHDLMKGPALFEDEIDMSARRKKISSLIEREEWRETAPLSSDAPPPRDPGPRWGKWYLALLNGHVVPFWSLLGRHATVPVRLRSAVWPIWRARQATFYDADGRKSYTVTHDKRRAWAIIWRSARATVRWLRNYSALREAHRAGYARLSRPDFWEKQFGEDSAKSVSHQMNSDKEST
ncbi:hypothetical protein GCM10011358_25050 [Sinisalibacter lacisalsi]|uniref:Glycosyltransferase n=2 Tax=Sinisalibacter lacisalsi TaxID=1526570 RepID=A0ABQ1QT37_9RHOB|nr:hypothetical protein GCM10011358_25050 [Sinisalibacter lacisalsi]